MTRCRLSLRLSPAAHDELATWIENQDLYFVSAPNYEFIGTRVESYDVVISCPNDETVLLVRLAWQGR